MKPANPPTRARQRTEALLWSTPANLAATLSLVSVLLALLGYGYALAVESRFGVPASVFAEGLLDHLRLSTPVIAHAVSQVSTHLWSPQAYARVLEAAALPLTGATLLWALIEWARCRPRVWRLGVACIQRRLRRLRKSHGPNAPRRAWHGQGWALLWLAGIWSLLPALAWLLTLVAGLFAVAVVVVPMAGYKAGLRSLQTWVVEPPTCIAPLTRQDRLLAARGPTHPSSASRRGATCVAVYQPGEANAVRGRLVVATTQWMVLFDPATGEVRRVPLGNATVRVVASLEAETPGQSVSPAALPR